MLPFNYDLNSVLFYPQIDTSSGSDIKKSKSNDLNEQYFQNCMRPQF